MGRAESKRWKFAVSRRGFYTREGCKGDGRRDILSIGAVIVAATQSEFELAYYYNYHHHYYYFVCFLVGVLAIEE